MKGDLIEVQLTTHEVLKWLSEKPKYSFEPHAFTEKIMHWHYCSKCGLVALRNKLTIRAIQLGCHHEYHVSWPRALRESDGR